MTIIVAITSPESIWMLADRRLSYPGRSKDDGRKVMFLETVDGVAILGYAGLGATGKGTEPCDWMSAVLRGVNAPLEQSLQLLSKAAHEQLPRHLMQFSRESHPAHSIIVPAFLGDAPRLYTIDLAFAPDRKRYSFRYTRHVTPRSDTPRLTIGGSGAAHLMRGKSWMRPLLRLVRATDRKSASPQLVANSLAKLNSEVAMADPLVGPRCIVSWRFRKGGVHRGGGGHQFYTGTSPDDSSVSLPTIATGMDINSIAQLIMPHASKVFEAMRVGIAPPEFDSDVINAELARLPHGPDEKLQ